MVDQSNIALANQLLNEANTIVRAISNIDGGGKITSMVIGVPPGVEPSEGLPAQVVTTYMDAPPAMYQAIRVLLVQRQQEINSELAGIGVTGVT